MDFSGQTLGNYKLESRIGRGPRATVYRARQMPGDRIVAVKVYDESVDPDRIRQAVESSQALTGAHALPPEDFGVHQGLAWVAMRHMPVGSIRSRRRGVVPLNDLARIVPQIASTLDHAHEHGLLHLNLEPGNILLDHPGNAFVADFGVPARPDSPYTAPELARGGTPDARSDVYSLGALLYEWLTGRPPVVRRPRDESANQRMADLPSPRSIRASIAPALEAVVMRALSIDPDSRPPTPGALSQAFLEAVDASAQEPSPAPSTRIPALGWVAGGIAGVAILVGVILASSGAGAPAPSPSPAAPTQPAAAATEMRTPTETPSPSPTRMRTRTLASTPAAASPTRPALTTTPSPAASLPAGGLTLTLLPNPTATPIFRVVSLVLKPPANRDAPGARLELVFDAIVEPETGGPFGQLFAYLPVIDSLVTTRIGAQVTSGVQVLKVTLVVDCAQLSSTPFMTDQIFLEIRPTDRGPTLYAQTIEYTKTWCK